MSLGFEIAGGLFGDGVSSATMAQVPTGTSGTKYVLSDNNPSNILTSGMFLIKVRDNGYYLYDDNGTPKATTETDVDDLMAEEDPTIYLWTFSNTKGTTTIRNVKTGRYLNVPASYTESVSMSNTGTDLTITNSGTEYSFSAKSGKRYYTLSLTSGSVSKSINFKGAASNNSNILNLYLVNPKTEPIYELNLKDNNGNAAEKYFDKTVSSLHYIGKYGTPIPLKHIYRNQDVQIVVNVHYNPASGVLYFETSDWVNESNDTTFD